MQGAKRQNEFVDTKPVTTTQPQPENPQNSAFQARAKEIGSFSAPLKLNSKAKIKGRVAVIEKSEFGTFKMKGFNADGDDYFQLDLDRFALTKDQLATELEEIETLILQSCDIGKQVGQYSISDGRKIPTYGLDCKISIIDYQTPAVIAEKKFTSRDLPTDIKVTSATTERTAFAPSAEMDKYIKNFQRQ